MLLSKLLDICIKLNDDEREVIVEIASRLLRGQLQYGKLDIDRDDRDFVKETGEELFDSCVYMATDTIRLRRQRASAKGVT